MLEGDAETALVEDAGVTGPLKVAGDLEEATVPLSSPRTLAAQRRNWSGTSVALALALLLAVLVALLAGPQLGGAEGILPWLSTGTRLWEVRDGACYTAVDGDPCYFKVKWEREHGLREHPQWYVGTGLDESSTDADFQANLHRKSPGECPQPCDVSPPVENTEKYSHWRQASNGTLSFYMYRAQSDENYELSNINTASLGGVLWYLHNEVVRPYCPRHYSITRILRRHVQVRNPAVLTLGFSAFVAFDKGRCTTPECELGWEQDGYTVGCQKQADTVYKYPNPIWYSLPGPCPMADAWGKSPPCREAHPGGKCAAPNGARDCTWSMEDAGEISIAELEGIWDYAAFCAQGGGEYDKGTDSGSRLDFWNGRSDAVKGQKRVDAVKKLFKKKYPTMPNDLPDPVCPWG